MSAINPIVCISYFSLRGEKRQDCKGDRVGVFQSLLAHWPHSFGFYEMAPLGFEICIRLLVTFDDFPDVGMTHTNLSSNLTFTEPVVMQV